MAASSTITRVCRFSANRLPRGTIRTVPSISATISQCAGGVVTFLFTDVKGSTRRWEADADLMRKALAAHDEVLRSAIEGHGGWLFKHALWSPCV
jgi:class 3 adenylate cyclase